tara:strand:+ start:790 stop:1122 length:333 start_codon:yes stop_codon:yes gene_type:complete
MTDSEQYAKAMMNGNCDLAFAIEKRHGLDGYPPEVVTIGLAAIAKGEDPGRAIAERLDPRKKDRSGKTKRTERKNARAARKKVLRGREGRAAKNEALRRLERRAKIRGNR